MLRALFVFALILSGATTVTAVAQPAEPAQIITERTRAVLDTLSTQREAFRADPIKLRTYVKSQLDDVMDRVYSAQLVLARHARTASREQVLAFAEALTNSLLNRYADAIIELDPQTETKILSSTPLRNGELMRVATHILRKGGEPVAVDYLFRQRDGQWMVFDVIVEGISYVQTYRTQFDELLRKQSLDEVIAKLKSGQIEVKNAD
ncbi:MAG: ABC transporter substrate-binding protein [Lysobacteraceae bacterium]